MSWSKAKRRQRLLVYAGTYNAPLTDEDRNTIDHALEEARDRVFDSIFIERRHLFLSSKTFTDGDDYTKNSAQNASDGFLGWAKSAYYLGDGNNGTVLNKKYPFRYAEAPEIPMLLSNLRTGASYVDPAIVFTDSKIVTFPAGLSGTFEFYQHPCSLADPSIADTETDTIPDDLEMLNIRGGFENIVKLMVSEIGALRSTQQQLNEWKAISRKLYLEKFQIDVSTLQSKEGMI